METHQFAVIVHRCHRAPFVGAKDDEFSFVGENEILLPLTLKFLVLLGISFCEFALTYRCHDDWSAFTACHCLEVVA